MRLKGFADWIIRSVCIGSYNTRPIAVVVKFPHPPEMKRTYNTIMFSSLLGITAILYKRDLWLKYIFANISNCPRLTECQFFFCYWWRFKLSKFIERKTLYPKTRLGPKSAFGGRTKVVDLICSQLERWHEWRMYYFDVIHEFSKL